MTGSVKLVILLTVWNSVAESSDILHSGFQSKNLVTTCYYEHLSVNNMQAVF
jgi:hypothetical protein